MKSAARLILSRSKMEKARRLISPNRIEDVINKRHALLGAFVNLKQLKGRRAFLIERDDLAIEDNLLDAQKLERIKQLRIVERLVERLVVARDQAHIFAVFESQGPR